MSRHTAAREEAAPVHEVIPSPGRCLKASRGWEPRTGRRPQASAISKAARVRGQARPRAATRGTALTDLPEELLHCVLAALPQTDRMRVRQVSRGLRAAVGRMPASLAVRLRVCLLASDGRDAAPASRPFAATLLELTRLQANASRLRQHYVSATRTCSPPLPSPAPHKTVELEALRAAQEAEAAAGRVRESSFRAFLAAGGASVVASLDLDILSFEGCQQLSWPPLPELRVLCVSSSGAGHRTRLHASQLQAFYAQVDRLVGSAPRLQRLVVEVPGYASHEDEYEDACWLSARPSFSSRSCAAV